MTKADIKAVRSLSDKTGRLESGLFVVEGAKMVREAAESGWVVERLFVTDRFSAAPGIAGITPEHVAGKEMERLSHLKTPSSALALVRMPHHKFSSDITENGLILALDAIQDPGNLGTIIRIADWFGIADVLCSPETADCYNPKVVQATMGALFRVRVHYTPLPETLAAAQAAGTPVYGACLDGEDIYAARLTPTGIIVMGNEGRGISPSVEALITRHLLIPPYPTSRRGSESLNVAAATAITCSEFRRPR